MRIKNITIFFMLTLALARPVALAGQTLKAEEKAQKPGSDPAIQVLRPSAYRRAEPRIPNPAASEISFENSQIDLPLAIQMAPSILASTNKVRKLDWLAKIREFSTNLQQRMVPILIEQFKLEKDDQVKLSLLHTVNWSWDTRVVDLCSMVTRKSEPQLKLLAGDILISYRQITGVELISDSFGEFSAEQQRFGRISLETAVRLFGFEFRWDQSRLRPNMNTKERGDVLNPQWQNWWNANKAKYLKGGQRPPDK